MADKNDVIQDMQKLSQALNTYHQGSLTAKYVSETVGELSKSEAVDFVGSFGYFLNKFAMLKTSEDLQLNETENELWRKVRSYKAIVYKLFPGIGM